MAKKKMGMDKKVLEKKKEKGAAAKAVETVVETVVVETPAVEEVKVEETKVEEVKAEVEVNEAETVAETPVKRRGRKPKAEAEEVKTEEAEVEEPVKKRRGRKPKTETTEEKVETAEPKKRGRKAKTETETAEVKETKVRKPRAKKLEMSYEEAEAKMHEANVHYTFDEYTYLLLDNKTVKKAIEAIKEACQMDLDEAVLKALYADLEKRVDITPKSMSAMKAELEEKMSRKTTSYEEDSQLYHDTFYFAGKLLEYAERFKLNSVEKLSEWTKTDVAQFYSFYMDMALKVLYGWEDKDVDNYEDFMSEVLSVFEDLQPALEFRFQIDLADIQIQHDFFSRGDSTFEYLLRENEIKDYIYYRYANAYIFKNLDKAKWIANRAFSVVDERYVYYPKLIEIVNK